MSIFKIIKKAPNSFWHLYNNGSKEVNLSDFEVVLDLQAQTFNIQCLNGANVPNQSVQVANIRVIDQTDGSFEETFPNVLILKNRLTTLGYTPYKSSTGIEEAPVDGNIYGRKDEGWINITSGGGSLFALPFTTDHLTATGNQYSIGDIVYYIGNVYRCIAANDSLLPTNTLYWTNLGAGNPLVQQPADWNATSGNNQILNKPTIPTTPTLQEVTDAGNVTTNPILLEDTGLQVEIGSSAGFPYFKMLNIESGQATLFDNSDNTDSRYAKFQDKNGTLAYMDDITIPTLQEVLDNNHDLVDGNFYAGTDAGLDNIGSNVNALGFEAAKNNEGESVNAFGASAASDNIGSNINALGVNAGLLNEGFNVNAFGNEAAINNTGDNVNVLGASAGQYNIANNVNAMGLDAARSNSGEQVNAMGNAAGLNNTFNNVNLFGQNATANEDGQTVLSKDGTTMARISTTDLTATRKYNLQDGDGTLAFLSDIPSSSGIPHATASGTDTYTATITGVAAYNDADAYLIRFTNGNTTGATLNINSLGAKTLYRNNDGALIGGDIISGGEMLCVYNSTNNHFQVIGTAPNSLFAYVTNDDSVTLTKGMPVYAFSGTGDRMTVKRANNTSDATSAQTVGLVLSTSIAANQKGLIMMQGLLDNLSILPTSTFADGDAVYLGATAGTITNVKPYAPNHLVYLGVVTTASNGSAGRMYVRIQNGFELSEIHDVDLITNAPTNNQVLSYDSATDLWVNRNVSEFNDLQVRRNGFILFDDLLTIANGTSPFIKGTLSSGQILASGNTQNNPGVITINCSATANSGAYVAYVNSATATSSFLSNNMGFDTIVSLGPVPVANTTIRTGLIRGTMTSADATEGCYFEIINTGIVGKTAMAGVRSSTTSFTLAANTFYHLRIIYNSTTLNTFQVYNMSGSLLFSATLSTNISTGVNAIQPTFLATSTIASATTIALLDYIAVEYPSYNRGALT